MEGGEGPAREFPAFAQPHIDPTPVTPRILLLLGYRVEEERGSAGKEANTAEGRWWWVVYRRIHSTRERTAKRIRGTRGSGWSSAKSRVLLSMQFLKEESCVVVSRDVNVT